MKVTSIVAEYNPFHNGHKYHIEETRRITGADAVVCVMSGNYVQRGEPAVLDKWARAEIALHNGADVVIEIPTVFCLGNASFYARASVKLIEALGNVDSICFGSESGDISELKSAADRLNSHSVELDSAIRSYSKLGFSYPKAREKAFEECFGESAEVLKGSNNVLAIEYLRNITSLEPYTIRRAGAGYNDSVNIRDKFQSSTGIREMLKQGGDISHYVPYNPDALVGGAGVTNASFDMIRYKLMSCTPEEIDNAPGGGEGIGNRLIQVARTASSVEELIAGAKSKRYTYTHVSRLIYQLLLGITVEMQACDPEYIRVLGFNEVGREVLRDAKRNEKNTLPVIMNLSKVYDISSQLMLDIHASDVYNLTASKDIMLNSDYKRTPIIISK